MTKTEAAEIIALDVRVWSRTNGIPITKDLVEARISELRGDGPQYAGTWKSQAAKLANYRTVLRIARKD